MNAQSSKAEPKVDDMDSFPLHPQLDFSDMTSREDIAQGRRMLSMLDFVPLKIKAINREWLRSKPEDWWITVAWEENFTDDNDHQIMFQVFSKENWDDAKLAP